MLFKYDERITEEVKEYFKFLGKNFTPNEFYTHLCIIFTNFPLKPLKKEMKNKENSIKEINGFLKDVFKIDSTFILPLVNVFFINTKRYEDEEEREKSTIDNMLKEIKLNSQIMPPINTINLDITGENAKKRIEEEKRK